MKKVVIALGLPVLIVLLAGCEALLLGAATDFTVTVDPSDVSIARGSTGRVSVSVSQTFPVTVLPAPIELTLHDPPTGVTAEALSIPSGIDKDDLIISVSAEAAVGGPTELTLRASNGLKTKEVAFNLTVR